jgi:hypothetical protein
MNVSRRRQVRAWLVLLVAIAAVLGHVMPLHAHADDPASATPGPGGPDDDRDVYRGSCEALLTTPAQLPPAP